MPELYPSALSVPFSLVWTSAQYIAERCLWVRHRMMRQNRMAPHHDWRAPHASLEDQAGAEKSRHVLKPAYPFSIADLYQISSTADTLKPGMP